MPNPLRVLVSAGASGIGAAIATRFRADGALVSVCDRDPDAVARAKARDSGVHALVADVSDAEAMQAWVEERVRAWGGIDVLVNNAGIAGPTALVEDIELADWRACLAVNIDSHFVLTRSVVPTMKRQRSGCIVNIASTAGLFGYGMRTPYATSKWAVIGFTKSIAIELGQFGIRANAVAPGSVDGERMAGVIAAEAAAKGVDRDQIEREYTHGQSIPRFVQPTEVAELCAFLASPAASMINGQVIAVDGNTETFPVAARDAEPE